MTGENWVSDEEFALIQQAKASLANDSSATVGDSLSQLREQGDEIGYEKARARALQDILRNNSDDGELERFSAEFPPFDTPAPEAAPQGPTEAEMKQLEGIFTDPAYKRDMAATDGSPDKMIAVYDEWDVPEEARLVTAEGWK